MDFDDLTEKEEMALACAADDIEKTLQTTAQDGTKKMGDGDNIVTQQDGDTDADGGAAKRNDSTNVTLLYKQGNLFSCPQTDSLAHCVSKDLRMGKGIAVLFKQKFGRVTELKQQANRVGDVAILKVGDRYIYYLITKPKYSDKPTYQTLETTLRGMKHHCVKYGVKRLSMPRIGCGLDRLMWPQVETLLRKVFSDTDLTITVYSL